MDENTYEAIRLENAGYLLWFKDYLVDHGLSIKTVDRHLNNLDFFLNDFLLHDEFRHMEDGLFTMDEYFGDYFVRNYKKATAGSVKSNVESIKKFYLCMFEHQKIKTSEYMELSKGIKIMLPGWLAKFNK